MVHPSHQGFWCDLTFVLFMPVVTYDSGVSAFGVPHENVQGVSIPTVFIVVVYAFVVIICAVFFR